MFTHCILIVLLSLLLVAAEESWARLPPAQSPRNIPPDHDFCISDDSICMVQVELGDACQPLYSVYDSTPWTKCMCENGYVAAAYLYVPVGACRLPVTYCYSYARCYWCELAIQYDGAFDPSYLDNGCSRVNVSIAPLPTSVVQRESRFNASYTGAIPSIVPPVSTTSASRSRTISSQTGNDAMATITRITVDGGGMPSMSITSQIQSKTVAGTSSTSTSTSTSGSPSVYPARIPAMSWLVLTLAAGLLL
ncbi:hypothetical protein GQ53DRAFT_360656 [Thozetella sp. PMI_491]|nr:hypothetical protein GQ53DRAFT_360656 [Thozetella sp. PMI_491]